MLKLVSPVGPARSAAPQRRASRFLSNVAVNKDVLGLLSCIHLYKCKPTCWFIRTQPQGGLDVSFPHYLSQMCPTFDKVEHKVHKGKTDVSEASYCWSHWLLCCLTATERKFSCKKADSGHWNRKNSILKTRFNRNLAVISFSALLILW